MKQLARYKNVILAVAIILVSLLLLRNLYSHYSLKIANLAKQEKDIAEAQVIMHKWEVLDSQFSLLKGNLLKEDTSLVKKFIEERAQMFNIEIESLRFSRFDKEAYWEVKAQFQATCTYNDFVKFVDSLAAKNIEITSARLSGSQDRVSVNAEAKGVVVK